MRDETVKEVGRQPAEISEIAMAVPSLLLGAQQLNQDFHLTPRELVNGVPMRRQIDQPRFLGVVIVTNADRPHAAEGSFELA